MRRWIYLLGLFAYCLPAGATHGLGDAAPDDPFAIEPRERDPFTGDTRKPLPPVKDDESLFQGEWQIESAHKRGKPHQRLVGDRITFEENKLTIRPKTDDGTEGQYRIRPDATPKEIDLTILTGDDAETMKGIYQFSGGKLQITFSPSGVARPKAFDTKEGEEQIGMVLKKIGEKEK